MNKAQKREVDKLLFAILLNGKTLGADYVARALSALIRSARTNKQKQELFAIARDVNVAHHPEFTC